MPIYLKLPGLWILLRRIPRWFSPFLWSSKKSFSSIPLFCLLSVKLLFVHVTVGDGLPLALHSNVTVVSLRTTTLPLEGSGITLGGTEKIMGTGLRPVSGLWQCLKRPFSFNVKQFKIQLENKLQFWHFLRYMVCPLKTIQVQVYYQF